MLSSFSLFSTMLILILFMTRAFYPKMKILKLSHLKIILSSDITLLTTVDQLQQSLIISLLTLLTCQRRCHPALY